MGEDQKQQLEQIHLASVRGGKRTGHSGRALRYRVLSSSQISHIEKQASRALTTTSTNYEFSDEVVQMALEQMVCAVSEPVGADAYAADPSKVVWRDVAPEQLHLEWDKLFTAKDTAALKKLYEREYVVTTADLEAILEGKVGVVP